MADVSESLTEQLDRERRSVSFDAYDITVRQLIDMVAAASIEIAPEYQRHFLWDERRESQLIESIFLGIPVPSLFMATNKDSTWEVVDGVQRLSTMLHFSGEPSLLEKIGRASALRLSGLETLTTLNGKRLVDIPKSSQLSFSLRPIKVTTLNDRSDLDVRYELFERLNTGGVKLHTQEIRNCIFRGKIRDQIKDLAHLPDYRNTVFFKKGEESEATYEECVLRFFAFMDRYKKFDHLVDKFLTGFAKDVNLRGVSQEQVMLFGETMAFIKDELPNGILRGRSSTPINLFEAIAVGVGLAFQSKKIVKKGVLKALLDDEDLKKYTQGGTNTRAMVAGRIEFVRDALV